MTEYLRVPSNAAWKIPASSSKVTLREAPVYGIGFGTACQALYQRLDVPYPPAKVEGERWFLVYGGSTSVGLFAVQLAKLAGFKVVATCSPRNFDLVKEYGADACVDYHDSSAAIREIRTITDFSLTRGLDTISEKQSLRICLESFADSDKDGDRKIQILLLASDESKKLAQERGIHLETNWVYTCISDVSPPCRPPIPDANLAHFVDLPLCRRHHCRRNPRRPRILRKAQQGYSYLHRRVRNPSQPN